MEYGRKPDMTTIKRKLKKYKDISNNQFLIRDRCDSLESKRKKEELIKLKEKYNINNSQIESVLMFYTKRNDLKNNDITNSVDFLNAVLQSIYNYTDEEVSSFLNKNAHIMKSKYSDIVEKIAVFNHFNMLDEVLFKGNYYLTYDFTISNFNSKIIYSILKSQNISSLEELNYFINKTDNKILLKLNSEFSLTNVTLTELKKELMKKMKKAIFLQKVAKRILEKGTNKHE